VSQDISEATCRWIPVPPLDREWDNDAVIEYFGVEEEREVIMMTQV
jgi:hypothetical protein